MKLFNIFLSVTTLLSYSIVNAETIRPTEKLSELGSLAKTMTEQTGQTVGSAIILKQCWSVAELQGTPTDKKVNRPVEPDAVPPDLSNIQAALNSSVAPQLRNCIRRVQPANGEKWVALTFDLCERNLEKTGYDAEIINYLRKNNVKATFFIGGKWMHSHPEKTQQLMADPLFELGNHAWTHGNMRVLTGREMQQQILWTQAEYQRHRQLLASQCPAATPAEMNKIPTTLRTFRFPYGTCSTESLQALATYGLPAIQWDVVTGDPAPKQTADGIAKIILNSVKPGSIIVAHANGRGHGTAQALSKFIPQLQQQGYQFVTVSELLASGRAETSADCYEETPGDNFKYDKIFGKGTE